MLKILTLKIENPVDEYKNKLGTAGGKKESVNWRGTSKEITKIYFQFFKESPHCSP